jgi:hypothetical protein
MMVDIEYVRILRFGGAVWGEMRVKDHVFVGVENRSKPDFDSVPAGTYQLQMGIKHTHRHVPCLRFIEIPGRKGVGHPFLIHDAAGNNWRKLEGCIAPGMSYRGAVDRLGESRAAMDTMLELLGGFTPGKYAYIYIYNNAPGDKWTKEDFISRRAQRLPT